MIHHFANPLLENGGMYYTVIYLNFTNTLDIICTHHTLHYLIIMLPIPYIKVVTQCRVHMSFLTL